MNQTSDKQSGACRKCIWDENRRENKKTRSSDNADQQTAQARCRRLSAEILSKTNTTARVRFSRTVDLQHYRQTETDDDSICRDQSSRRRPTNWIYSRPECNCATDSKTNAADRCWIFLASAQCSDTAPDWDRPGTTDQALVMTSTVVARPLRTTYSSDYYVSAGLILIHRFPLSLHCTLPQSPLPSRSIRCCHLQTLLILP